MEQTGLQERRTRLLHTMSTVPQMMLALRHRHNMYEFVLHDLCAHDCFNLQKAAYIVDNPAFNCLHGIAGYASDEMGQNGSILHDPEQFSQKMQNSVFNNKVKSIEQASIKLKNQESIAHDIADVLGLKNYDVCYWDMIYDNHGIFMFEKADPEDSLVHDYLLSGLSLLTFCPVF